VGVAEGLLPELLGGVHNALAAVGQVDDGAARPVGAAVEDDADNVVGVEILRAVVDYLTSREKTPDREQLLNDLLSLMACHAAVRAGDRLTPEEIAALLEQRELAQDSHHCPHAQLQHRQAANIYLERLDHATILDPCERHNNLPSPNTTKNVGLMPKELPLLSASSRRRSRLLVLLSSPRRSWHGRASTA
jgi:hypothetical protein